VCEHRFAGDVADGEDVVDVRACARVGLDEAAVVGFDPSFLEIERLGDGRPADGYEDVLDIELEAFRFDRLGASPFAAAPSTGSATTRIPSPGSYHSEAVYPK